MRQANLLEIHRGHRRVRAVRRYSGRGGRSLDGVDHREALDRHESSLSQERPQGGGQGGGRKRAFQCRYGALREMVDGCGNEAAICGCHVA